MYINDILNNESYEVMMHLGGILKLTEAQILLQFLIEDMRDPIKYTKFFKAIAISNIVFEASNIGKCEMMYQVYFHYYL